MAAAVATSPQNPDKTPSSLAMNDAMKEVDEQQRWMMQQIKLATYSPRGSEKIPLIDIGPSFNGTKEARQRVADQIGAASRNVGFFQISNHGVSLAAREGIMEQARRFFHTLSLEKKENLHIKHSPIFRGWEPSGYTNTNPDDWAANGAEAIEGKETKECFNFGYESSLDSTGGDGKYVEIDGNPPAEGSGNVWPNEEDLPGFMGAIRAYYEQILDLSRHLFKIFAISLNLPENYFDKMVTHPGGISRLLYYPPQKDVERLESGDSNVGLGAHTDYECFTLLLSDSNPGLEVLAPTEPGEPPKWLTAPADTDNLTVNIGDFMTRWTNGVYRSTIHRVVNRSPGLPRYSVPFFFSINYDETVETLPSCITEDNPARYPPLQAGAYVQERLRATLKEVAEVYKKD